MIDLCCGVGGWAEGGLAEGYDVVGFDIERHIYGQHRYPAQLVIQNILTLHGSQFRKAALIVASPPCQKYSYMAMPWTRAKAKAREIRADESGQALADLTRLFDACFRIQREACEAAGRHIPLVVENVRGAQKWVGRARWSFGSFYLWGDVPALMPITSKAIKVPTMGGGWYPPDHPKHVKGLGFNTHANRNCREDIKNTGGSWFNVAHNTTSGKGQNPDGRKQPSRCDCAHPETTPSGFAAVSVDCPIHGESNDGPTVTTCFPSFPSSRSGGPDQMWQRGFQQSAADQLAREGVKQRGSGREWFAGDGKISRMTSSKSPARKMASAMIAKIPEPLSRYIAKTFRPDC
jgi:hypothetical protein